MRIELATIQDVPELLELQHKAFGPLCMELEWEDAPPMTESLEQAYEEFAQCTTLKVQNDEGCIIGSVYGNVTDGSLYIGRLMVLPEYQQQGIGKQLFREIQQLLPHNRVWLCTCQQVPAPYNFYLREEFKPFKSEKVGPNLTWVYMEKNDYSRAWKVLHSEYLIKRPWLTARRDKVELPDGRIIPEYYVLEYPDWVNVIAITKDGHFVMERQYRHALGQTSYELPCGVMEEGETPLEAAQRELMEETGYGGGVWKKLMELSANPSTMTNLAHCFLATDVEKVSEQHLDATEELEVHLMTREEVCNLLRNNEIRQSLMVAPLLRYLSPEL